MKKKLHSLFLLPILLIGFLFSSCEADKNYYYEDPSFNWESSSFYINATGKDGGKWEWNSATRRYECVYDLTGKFENEDSFIYNKGFFIGYVFFGDQNTDETQHIMPFNDRVNGGKLTYDTSFRLFDKGHELTACFYFEWNDGRQSPPPAYNFRLYLGWGKQ